MSYVGATHVSQYIGKREGGGGTTGPAPPAKLIRRTVTSTSGAGVSVEDAWNAEGVSVGDADFVKFVHDGVVYTYHGATGNPANAASAEDFVGAPVATPPSQGKNAVMIITQRVTDPVIDINSDNFFYTHSGNTDMTLGATAAEFMAENDINITRDGVGIKTSVVWITSTTLRLPGIYDPQQQIVVETP